MKKTLQITQVRVILGIDNPIVVFETLGHEAIVRNPKQALTDLQNSGRCLDVDAKEFANGVEGASAASRAKFQKALLTCTGAQITGDFTVVKAGDKYTPNDNHPIFTTPSYKGFGSIKKGEQLVAEKDGVWTEGFCSIPLTNNEQLNDLIATKVADAFGAMYGFGAPAVATNGGLKDPDGGETPDPENDEAFNLKAKTKAGK